ncbi:MAG: hypothetical protein KDN22_04670 [Verrucomicrobiae bacterium]|nr:hypothetical protein [Verrucomicrobiae bacterium]
MTPACHEVIYREIDELSADSSDIVCDLVAISSLTARIDDAFVLANTFRSCGVLVVIGGIHASVLPRRSKPVTASASATPSAAQNRIREKIGRRKKRKPKI